MLDQNSLDLVIKDALEAKAAAAPKMAENAGGFTAENLLGVIDFRSLLDVVALIIKDGSVTRDDAQYVIKWAEDVYDQYIAPLDLPVVGPILEPQVDRVLRAAIGPAVNALFDALLPA